MRIPSLLRTLILIAASFCAAAVAADPGFVITPGAADAAYVRGATISWKVEARDMGAIPVDKVAYTVKKGSLTVLSQGTLDLSGGPATVTAKLDEPGSAILEVTAKVPGKKDVQALSGAVVEPRLIKPSAPRPDDFDAFWKAKLDELAAVPANPRLEKMPADRPGAEYWQITMDNIRGTHIRGQLARPAKPGRCPAMLIVQWAGVYPLGKAAVTVPATKGWLVLNLNAHDLPIDQPEAFYKQHADTDLKSYTAIGNDDRETSYFLRMFLSCSRGVDYLAGHPDWDGKTLVVAGGSQGGLQALVAAALNPKVTALTIFIPAGCDHTAMLAGRAPGWPNWLGMTQGKDPAKVRTTAGYYDGVNFASRVTCPVLVGVGLVDATSRPDSVFAAINQLKGPVEVVTSPTHGHQASPAFYQRQAAWQEAMLKGNLNAEQSTSNVQH